MFRSEKQYVKVSQELFESLKELTHSGIHVDGRELCNPIPKEIPVDGDRPTSLTEQVRRILRRELSGEMEAQGMESFDEANDFDVDDGFEVKNEVTKYTLLEDEELVAKELPLQDTEKPATEEIEPAEPSGAEPAENPLESSPP